MAFIVRRSGGWFVRWREGGRGAKQHSKGPFTEKHLATAWARTLEVRQEAQAAPKGIAITARALAERWRIHLAKRGRSPRYRDHGPDTVIRHLGDTPLDRLDRDRLLGLGVGARRVVQACLRWGLEELAIGVRPECLKLKTGTGFRRAERELMPPEVAAAIQAKADRIGPSMGAVVHLVSTYGHRPESLARMTAGDLSKGKIRLVVKGGDEIRHPVLAETVERLSALAKGMPRGAPLLLDPITGDPFPSGWAIAMRYRSALGRALWPQEPGIYALKRYAISYMLERGLDPATIASITGHRRPDVLLRHYARTNENRQRSALAVLGAPRCSPESS